MYRYFIIFAGSAFGGVFVLILTLSCPGVILPSLIVDCIYLFLRISIGSDRECNVLHIVGPHTDGVCELETDECDIADVYK